MDEQQKRRPSIDGRLEQFGNLNRLNVAAIPIILTCRCQNVNDFYFPKKSTIKLDISVGFSINTM
jgi:hypothetical protein